MTRRGFRLSGCLLLSCLFAANLDAEGGGIFGPFTVTAEANGALKIAVYNPTSRNSTNLFQVDSPSAIQVLVSLGDETVVLDNSLATKGSELGLQAWKYRDVSVELRVKQIDPGWMVLQFVATNGGRNPQTLSLRLVGDVSEGPNRIDLTVGDKDLGVETLVSAKKAAQTLVLTDKQAGSKVQIGFGTQNASGYAESLIVSNIQRLRSLVHLPDVQEGRNFSYLPFSVNDRGLSFVFAETLVLPAKQTSWYLPFSLGTMAAADGDKLAKQLNSMTDTVLLPPTRSTELSQVKDLNEVNELLRRINQAMDQGSRRQDEYEKTLEQLETLKSQSGK